MADLTQGSPEWWDSLTPEKKKALEEFIAAFNGVKGTKEDHDAYHERETSKFYNPDTPDTLERLPDEGESGV